MELHESAEESTSFQSFLPSVALVGLLTLFLLLLLPLIASNKRSTNADRSRKTKRYTSDYDTCERKMDDNSVELDDNFPRFKVESCGGAAYCNPSYEDDDDQDDDDDDDDTSSDNSDERHFVVYHPPPANMDVYGIGDMPRLGYLETIAEETLDDLLSDGESSAGGWGWDSSTDGTPSVIHVEPLTPAAPASVALQTGSKKEELAKWVEDSVTVLKSISDSDDIDKISLKSDVKENGNITDDLVRHLQITNSDLLIVFDQDNDGDDEEVDRDQGEEIYANPHVIVDSSSTSVKQQFVKRHTEKGQKQEGQPESFSEWNNAIDEYLHTLVSNPWEDEVHANSKGPFVDGVIANKRVVGYDSVVDDSASSTTTNIGSRGNPVNYDERVVARDNHYRHPYPSGVSSLHGSYDHEDVIEESWLSSSDDDDHPSYGKNKTGNQNGGGNRYNVFEDLTQIGNSDDGEQGGGYSSESEGDPFYYECVNNNVKCSESLVRSLSLTDLHREYKSDNRGSDQFLHRVVAASNSGGTSLEDLIDENVGEISQNNTRQRLDSDEGSELKLSKVLSSNTIEVIESERTSSQPSPTTTTRPSTENLSEDSGYSDTAIPASLAAATAASSHHNLCLSSATEDSSSSASSISSTPDDDGHATKLLSTTIGVIPEEDDDNLTVNEADGESEIPELPRRRRLEELLLQDHERRQRTYADADCSDARDEPVNLLDNGDGASKLKEDFAVLYNGNSYSDNTDSDLGYYGDDKKERVRRRRRNDKISSNHLPSLKPTLNVFPNESRRGNTNSSENSKLFDQLGLDFHHKPKNESKHQLPKQVVQQDLYYLDLNCHSNEKPVSQKQQLKKKQQVAMPKQQQRKQKTTPPKTPVNKMRIEELHEEVQPGKCRATDGIVIVDRTGGASQEELLQREWERSVKSGKAATDDWLLTRAHLNNKKPRQFFPSLSLECLPSWSIRTNGTAEDVIDSELLVEDDIDGGVLSAPASILPPTTQVGLGEGEVKTSSSNETVVSEIEGAENSDELRIVEDNDNDNLDDNLNVNLVVSHVTPPVVPRDQTTENVCPTDESVHRPTDTVSEPSHESADEVSKSAVVTPLTVQTTTTTMDKVKSPTGKKIQQTTIRPSRPTYPPPPPPISIPKDNPPLKQDITPSEQKSPRPTSPKKSETETARTTTGQPNLPVTNSDKIIKETDRELEKSMKQLESAITVLEQDYEKRRSISSLSPLSINNGSFFPFDDPVSPSSPPTHTQSTMDNMYRYPFSKV